MADRTLQVKLRADVGQYRKAMADASKSTDQVARAGQALQNAGGRISSVGDNLTKSVTVPMALAGVAAVKMAGDFDQAFTQMVGLAGVSASEVDGLKDSVLDLAGETGRAPQELAEGLLMIRSAGLSGQDALDVLEASAKAAATGMGDTATVANALTNVMNGYGAGNITAAEAMDVLTASVREGKAEAQDMAPQFGRLVPIAAELGVSFGDVAGSMAFLTKATGDASQSSTALQGILSKLLRPSQQGAQALEEVGISGDGVRQMLGEKGLHGTLVALRERLGDNGFQLLFDDVQALNGALQMTGPGAKDAVQVIDRVTNSAGSASDAFANWAESMGAKNAQAFAQFQVALIRVGETLAPIAADVLSAVASIAEAFSGLPDGAQKTIIAIAAVAAAVGPLMSVGGRLVMMWGGLMKTWSGLQGWTAPANAVAGAFNNVGTSADKANVSASRFARGLNVVGSVAGWLALATAVGQVADAIDPLERADMSKLENSLLSLGQNGKLSGEAAKILGENFDDLGDAVERIAAPSVASQAHAVLNEITTLGGLAGRGFGGIDEAKAKIDDLDKALASLARKSPRDAAAALEAITSQMESQGVPAERLTRLLDDYDSALAEIDTDEATSGAAGLTDEMGDQAEATGEATSALQGYADALKAQTDPIFAAMDAMTGIRDAQVGYQDALVGVQEAQGALDEAIANHGATSAEAADAQRGLEDAQRAVTDAQWAQVTSASEADAALAGLLDAVERGDVDVDTFRQTLQQWVDQGFLPSAEAADIAAWSVGGLASQAEEADKKRVDIPVDTPGSEPSKERLRRVRDAAFDIPGSRSVSTSTVGDGDARNRLWSVRDAAFAIPSSRNIDITATITSLARGIFPSLRAEGGPVRAGEAYIVGEKRPELFIPDQDGTILPSVPQGDVFASTGLAGGLGGGATYVTEVHVGQVVANDPQSLVNALVRYVRNNGPVPIRVNG